VRAIYLIKASVLVCMSGALLGGFAVAQDEAAPPVDVVSERLDALYRSSSSVGRIELSVVTPRRERSLRMQVWSRGLDRSLVVIESPSRERGTATLRVERNLWNYLPRIARTMRVPPSMMLSSWMGSDFTNDDLVQGSSFARDFVGRAGERSDSPRGWRYAFDAREGVVGLWKRIEYVMNEDASYPLVARYYDRRMRLARTLTFDEVREMDGRRIPTRLTIRPTREEGQRTVLRYLELDFDADVPESTFSLSRLERGR
jgi:hypothetical protein